MWVFLTKIFIKIGQVDQMDFLGGSEDKNPSASAGDTGSIPGLGKSSGEGNGNPLQYSCLGNPKDRGALQAGYRPWSCKE